LIKILQGFKRKLEALEKACQYLSKEELEGNELSTEKTEQDAEFIPEPKTTSLVIEEQINLNINNDKFAISTGILHNGTKTTTVSQAIDALEIQKSTDFKCSMTVMEMRAFILRIYWTTLKIAHR